MPDIKLKIGFKDCTNMSLIGKGGFGSVIKTDINQYPHQAAIKILEDPANARRFSLENDILYRLNKIPGVIEPLSEILIDGGHTFYLMELADFDLEKYSDIASIDSGEKIELFIQICNALKSAHDIQVVHRDIHYGNVLVKEVNAKYVAKLTDFGLAKDFEDQTASGYTPGELWGRLDARAPETFFLLEEDVEFSHYAVKSDLYALGIVLFFLLGGLPQDTAWKVVMNIRKFLNKKNALETTTRKSLSIPVFNKSIDKDQRKQLYVEWRNENLSLLEDDFELYSSDLSPDQINRLQQIIIKSCSIDSSERYSDISELIGEVGQI